MADKGAKIDCPEEENAGQSTGAREFLRAGYGEASSAEIKASISIDKPARVLYNN